MRPAYGLILTVLVVLALVLVGCGKTQPAAGGNGSPPIPGAFQGKNPTPTKMLQLGLVPKVLNNPVFEIADDGAEAASKELGDVQVLFSAPENPDTAKQIQIIEGLIDKKVDGIAISCNQGDALVSVINKAIAAGIPTITFDSDSPKSNRLTYYGIDSKAAGVEQAKLLIKAFKSMGEKPEGKVVIQSGVAGAPNLEDRINGVKSVLAKYPGIKLLSTLYCDEDTAKAVGELKDVMRANPDLKGMILVGGWAMFATAPGAFEDVKPNKIAVISFDALPQEWDYVRQGYCNALVAQRCWLWGYESMKILHDIIVDHKTEPKFIDSGLDIVTKANVEEYAKKWRDKDFKPPAGS